MKIEFEIVFTWVDHNEMREKILELNWKCVLEKTLMKRVVFDNPVIEEWSYVRVRDEWWKITCTYKEVSDDVSSIDAVKELETVIQDFDVMVDIFTRLWLKKKAYQETYREAWKINNEVEIMLDIWPWLKPFIEIEWENEEVVKKYSKILWFEYSEWLFGAVDQVYLKELWMNPDVINSLAEITFDNIPKK